MSTICEPISYKFASKIIALLYYDHYVYYYYEYAKMYVVYIYIYARMYNIYIYIVYI